MMTSKSSVNFVSIKVCMYTNVLSTFFLYPCSGDFKGTVASVWHRI